MSKSNTTYRVLRLSDFYTPQEKQKMLHQCRANEILYGGAAGPGKSHGLRYEAVKWCMRVSKLQAYLFRKTTPELERNHIIPSLQEFPKELGSYKDQKKRWEFYNGSMLHFCHVEYEKDVFIYQGAELHLLLIDELTQFTEFTYDYLRSRVRCTLPIPLKYRGLLPRIVCATNPGGPGHEFCKRRWVDFAKPYELKRAKKKEGGMVRCYIPGLLEDNKILMDSNPGYIHQLDAMPEPYRTAYKTGNWDIYFGQALKFNKTDHVIKPIPIPEHAPIYMTFDWGHSAPFSVGWWWVDGDGRIYRFGELYGWDGKANSGLKYSDPEVAKMILEEEESLGISKREIMRLGGSDCFKTRIDYLGQGRGPTTAEIFSHYGINMYPGDDKSRINKIRQFHNRLAVPDDGSPPMMLIYDTCEQFIRTIPLLQNHPTNVEDIDSRNAEDHCVDDQTEILTDEGWKLFKNLNKREKVATLSKNGFIEYQLPYDYIDREYNGIMYEYDGRVNFSVTGKHRFPTIGSYNRQRKRYDKFTPIEIENITNKTFHIPRTGKWNVTEDVDGFIYLPKTDNGNANNVEKIDLKSFIKYYGFWLAEGCMAKVGAHYNVHVDQKDGGEDIVASLGYKFHKTINKAGCTRYSIQSKQFYNFMHLLNNNCKAHTKFIPRQILDMPREYLELLFEGMMFGDGTGDYKYDTSSKQLADDFQELLFKIGKVGNIKTYEQKQNKILGKLIKTKHPLHRINIFRKTKMASILTNKITKSNYNGKVYCVRVPNETIYLRRKGTPYWSMNCYDESCHICMDRPIGIADEALAAEKAEQAEKAKIDGLSGFARAAWESKNRLMEEIRIREEEEQEMAEEMFDDLFWED